MLGNFSEKLTRPFGATCIVQPSGKPSVFKFLLRAPVADPADITVVTIPAKRSPPGGPEDDDDAAGGAGDALEVPEVYK